MTNPKRHDEPSGAMTLDQYQARTDLTAVYPEGTVFRQMTAGQLYCALKLASEAGDVADKIAKLMRDKDGFVNDADRDAIAKELGDVMWYVARMAIHVGYSLEAIATLNLTKLAGRKDRGTLKGSGDNR